MEINAFEGFQLALDSFQPYNKFIGKLCCQQIVLLHWKQFLTTFHFFNRQMLGPALPVFQL